MTQGTENPVLQYDSRQLDGTYRYWRLRILYSTIIGYAVFYLVRVNIAVALPAIERDLHVSKTQLGTVLSISGVLYGISKFANGFLGDRVNPRIFMPLGLICSAIMNICCGFSAGLVTFGTFWLLNGWFQGMGFPPCARLMSHWFAPSERSTSFGLWNSGHQLGAAGASVLSGFLVAYDWRYCFLVPAAIAIAGSIFLINRLRDTPESLGLPSVEEYRGELVAAEVEHAAAIEDAHESHTDFVIRHVFAQKFVWIVSIANFFVYTLRYSVLNWGPTFLAQTKGTTLLNTGFLSAGSEIAGLFGAILGGWLTDKLLGGRAGRMCFIATIAMAAAIFLFWKTPSTSPKLYTAFFVAMGFLIYIPQLLIAVIAMNISTKRAAATAVGLTGIFGYASTVLSGWGVGRLVDRFGWNAAFKLMILCCVAMGLLFLLTWNVGSKDPARPTA